LRISAQLNCGDMPPAAKGDGEGVGDVGGLGRGF